MHIACIHLSNIKGKSVVHVRALTYCDIHTINVEKLKEVLPTIWPQVLEIYQQSKKRIYMKCQSQFQSQVLEFYRPFSHTFSRNLCLSFVLSKRTVFSKARGDDARQQRSETLILLFVTTNVLK